MVPHPDHRCGGRSVGHRRPFYRTLGSPEKKSEFRFALPKIELDISFVAGPCGLAG
jgi:hypothetical protein